ncbi:hypothetical protein N665_0263s0009 [Sinapis alba]|nr:hypothetical protein N665_0263s0009 [Sinapis alba]
MTCREGLMSPQTETKASDGFKAGVKEYKLTYYTPEYETKYIDIVAASRVTPQPGVPPEEAMAATTVWTDGLPALTVTKDDATTSSPFQEKKQIITYVAYPLAALHLEDLRIPPTYTSNFQGPPHGIQVERDILNKYGRPLLGCTIKPKLGLSAKNYGRAVYECLRGGLDFTKDDENVNSQPFMRWRDRFLFCAETGEIKRHYLNATTDLFLLQISVTRRRAPAIRRSLANSTISGNLVIYSELDDPRQTWSAPTNLAKNFDEEERRAPTKKNKELQRKTDTGNSDTIQEETIDSIVVNVKNHAAVQEMTMSDQTLDIDSNRESESLEAGSVQEKDIDTTYMTPSLIRLKRLRKRYQNFFWNQAI